VCGEGECVCGERECVCVCCERERVSMCGECVCVVRECVCGKSKEEYISEADGTFKCWLTISPIQTIQK
jgi:hypothetical protein